MVGLNICTTTNHKHTSDRASQFYSAVFPLAFRFPIIFVRPATRIFSSRSPHREQLSISPIAIASLRATHFIHLSEEAASGVHLLELSDGNEVNLYNFARTSFSSLSPRLGSPFPPLLPEFLRENSTPSGKLAATGLRSERRSRLLLFGPLATQL